VREDDVVLTVGYAGGPVDSLSASVGRSGRFIDHLVTSPLSRPQPRLSSAALVPEKQGIKVSSSLQSSLRFKCHTRMCEGCVEIQKNSAISRRPPLLGFIFVYL
jgi:hypothetical protein